MGKAAARCGDTANTCNDPSDLPAGKVIAAGTVLINKMPAAKQTDKIAAIDSHIIMIPAPPGPPIPTPLPHPFSGMISSACSTSVNIMGLPAATVDSQADNVPPHLPQGGPFQKPPTNKAKIIMGSPDVFIGNGGGGGGGGSGATSSTTAEAESKEVEEGHYLDVKFADKGGKPIMGVNYSVKDPAGNQIRGPLTGQVKKTGTREGEHTIELKAITKVGWSKTKAKVGDKLKLQAELAGFESGLDATFLIFRKDTASADCQIATLEEKTSGDKVEAEWELEYRENESNADLGRTKLERYSFPQFYFIIDAGGLRERSGMLQMTDDLEIELCDENGNPMKDEPYQVFLSNGEVREGKLDQDGKATIKNVPARKNRVVYPGQSEAKKLPE